MPYGIPISGGAVGGAGAGLLAGLGPAALLALAPGLISSLFGNSQKKLQKKINKIQSPENLQALIQQYYKQALSSPAYAQAQGSIATGANQTSGDIANSLAQRGLGTSGVGAILPGLVGSIVGGQQANLRTGAYQGAQGQAQNTIQNQIQALMGTSGPSQSQQLFAGGLSALGPLFADYFKQRYNPQPQQQPSY